MIRIGQSTDIHQLVKGRKLILGGVEIEHELGLLGHSDADALLHAIAESILGALALGDLGKHFPDTDERYKDMNSLWMLKQVYKIMDEKGYAIGNLDAMIMICLLYTSFNVSDLSSQASSSPRKDSRIILLPMIANKPNAIQWSMEAMNS